MKKKDEKPVQWRVRSTGSAVRWITKISDTVYWFEGRSLTIRNGYTGDDTNVERWAINYVDFDGGPTVRVGSTLHAYGVDGEDEFRTIKKLKMKAVPAKDLPAEDWVRVEVETN